MDSSVTKQETAQSNDNRRRGTDCATEFCNSATGGDNYPSYDTLQADITAEFYEYQSQPGYTRDKHLLWKDSLFTEIFGYSNPWNCTCTSATILPCKVYKNGSGAGN
jgi:hypothetical protein